MSGAPRKPARPRGASRRPEPEGFEPARPEAAPAPRPRPRPAAPGRTVDTRPAAVAPGPPTILTDLLRGPLAMVGQVTGIEGAARAMERLAASAERAAAILDRLDEEVGIDRVISVLERLERLSETADQMNRSLRAVERLALDVQKRVIEPFERLPIPRALRGTLGGGGGRSSGKPER